MIAIERVDFVSVPTRDKGRAMRFYGEILGLPQAPGVPDEFETGNVTLGLWEPEADGEPFVPNTAGIALRVRTSGCALAPRKPQASSSSGRRSTRASATWGSSWIPTETS